MAKVDKASSRTAMIFKGCRVRQWIYSDGQFHDFQRIAIEVDGEDGSYDLSQLGQGESILNPGVIYKVRAQDAKKD